jgi:hypothetical protein
MRNKSLPGSGKNCNKMQISMSTKRTFQKSGGRESDCHERKVTGLVMRLSVIGDGVEMNFEFLELSENLAVKDESEGIQMKSTVFPQSWQ